MAKIITEYEIAMRENLAEEVVLLNGSLVKFYALNKTATIPTGDEIAILYGEASEIQNWVTTEYPNLPAYVQLPTRDNQTTEAGSHESLTCEMYIAKKSLRTLSAPTPKKGDVLQHPTFGAFDVETCVPDGFCTDDATSNTQFIVNCVANTRFTPEQRI